MDEEQLKQAKEVEFYAASVNAWFNTHFERDKSLLTLSTAAIGILVTLMTTVIKPDYYSLALSGLALVFFLICTFTVLKIFRDNAEHLVHVVQNEPSEVEQSDKALRLLDKRASVAFFAGVVLVCILGVYNVYVSIATKEADAMKSSNTQKPGKPTIAQDSLCGATRLSVGGISKMQPSNQPKPGQTQTSQPVSNPSPKAK